MKLIDVENIPYIDLIAEANGRSDDFIEGLRTFQKWIKEQPIIDAVPVVRCKDCIHKSLHENAPFICHYCDIGIATKPEDFCSYGERK